MRGTDSQTGKAISGLDHLKQSIRDILTTPVGSRVMRREYGSRLFSLVDAPMNQTTKVDIYAATAEALRKWEPRLKVTSVGTQSVTPGKVAVEVNGTYGGTAVSLVVTV